MSEKDLEISRRSFLVSGGTALTTLLAGMSFTRGAEATSRARKVLHVIGHSHIDAAWLWPWRDSSNTALTTFRSALDRMRETPGFKYTNSSAVYYKWIEQADPAMFAEMKRRHREGRFEIVGGWPTEPDCNIPSTESFVRHCAYGKEYFRKAFGVEVNIGFNPDSFGHPAGLPTILKGAGYRYYVFLRPQEHEMDLPLLFWWEGPDRSRVLALCIRDGYSRGPDRLLDAAANNFQAGFDHGVFFFGVGNHGGAVTREQIKKLIELRRGGTLPEIKFSTLKEFFAEAERSPAFSQLPVVRGELQHHARGCYSAHGEIKQLNRRGERLLGDAETISTVAAFGPAGRAYPHDDLKKGWWKLLFNQDHNILTGAAMYNAYRDARDSLGWASDTAVTEKVGALERMARIVDTRHVKEGAVFAFNTLPWPRKVVLEFHTDGAPENPNDRVTHLSDQSRNKIPMQWLKADAMTQIWPKLSAVVDLPACGYKVFELAHGEGPKFAPKRKHFEISENGFGISSLKAEDGRDLLNVPIGLVVIGDPSDTWAHNVSKFRGEMGRPQFVSSLTVADGPVVKIVRHRARWGKSEIVLDILQYHELDTVELRSVVDWYEREQILMLEVPTVLKGPQVFAKVPGTVVERNPNGEEEPYQDWVALEGRIAGEPYTVALLNDSTYSYNCLDGLLRTIIVRSAPFARHDPRTVPHNDNNAWQDQGRNERRFWIVRGKGNFTTSSGSACLMVYSRRRNT